MPSDDPVASKVVRRVLTRAIGDSGYRRTLLENPNEVMRIELARAGGPVPDIQFDAVEETATRKVLRVPVSRSERQAQQPLQPVFAFVDAAGAEALDRFVHAPTRKLEELLDVEIAENIDIVVRIESEGQRVLVIPQNEFSPIDTDAGSASVAAPKIKLCPKGVTIDVCPKDVTVDLCPKDVTIVDVCPTDCTFTASCGCTISCTSTGDFPTIGKGPRGAARQESVQQISDLLDE